METADNAFNYVKQLVANGAQKVTLVDVQDKVKLEKHPKERIEEFNTLDHERLEDLKQILLKTGAPKIDAEVCFGAPFVEITRLIRERDAQLVVMKTQARGFAGELFLGGVSHNVARSSIASVLLIPPVR